MRTPQSSSQSSNPLAEGLVAIGLGFGLHFAVVSVLGAVWLRMVG